MAIEDNNPPGMNQPPKLTAVRDDSDPSGMTVIITADNHGRGAVLIDFGDLSARVRNPGDGTTPSPHPYDTPGAYTVSANSVSGGPTGTLQVVLPYVVPPKPAIAVGANKFKVSVTVNNKFLSNVYEAQWTPGGPWQQLNNDPPTASHNYPAHLGPVTVTVRYRDQPDNTASATVVLPASRPEIGDYRDLAPDKRTWTIWVANPLPGQQYVIQWESVDFGDSGKGWEPMIGWPPHAHHTYPDAPEYIRYAVNIRYKGDGPQPTTLGVAAPWQHYAPPLIVQAKDSVATVYVAAGYYNHTFEIQWDTGAPWEPMVSVGQQHKPAVSTHLFPAGQTSATVSVRDHMYPELVKTTTLTLPDMAETWVLIDQSQHDEVDPFEVHSAQGIGESTK